MAWILARGGYYSLTLRMDKGVAYVDGKEYKDVYGLSFDADVEVLDGVADYELARVSITFGEPVTVRREKGVVNGREVYILRVSPAGARGAALVAPVRRLGLGIVRALQKGRAEIRGATDVSYWADERKARVTYDGRSKTYSGVVAIAFTDLGAGSVIDVTGADLVPPRGSTFTVSKVGDTLQVITA